LERYEQNHSLKKESLDHIKEQMTSAGSQVYAILKEKIKEDLK